MAESTEDSASTLRGMNLLIGKPTITANRDKCIICQKDGQKLHGGEAGRKRVRDIAEMKQDVVYKRINIIGPDCEFKYHNTYSCYKQYTDKRNITTLVHNDSDDDVVMAASGDGDELLELTNSMSTRSNNVPRPGPSTMIDPRYVECAICGNDRIQVNGKTVREKYRICQDESAVKFIQAMRFKEDNVFQRCADLDTCGKIFAADIYCHNSCYKRYVKVPNDHKFEANPLVIKSKHDLFLLALPQLDTLIQDGYGLTVTEINEFMCSFLEDDDIEIYNRDVKKLLRDHYGDNIQFCPSHKANESEMCFSSTVTIEDITARIRDMDVVKTCAEILRKAIMKVDFKLDDSFCDGNDLKQSWENTKMPDQLLTFFSSLFGTKRSRMLKCDIINMPPDDEEPNDTDPDTEDTNSIYPGSTEDLQWSTTNEHNQLNCLFQIMYYEMFKGKKKTPLHVSFGHFQYGKGRSREIITVANHIGVSTSYNDVKRSRRLLAAHAVKKSSDHEVPIPSSFEIDSFTIGALDNADFSDKSSISGMHSDHITMQVLFQEIISSSSSKPRVSETQIQRSQVKLPDKLQCQEIPHHPKPTIRPELPPNFVLVNEINSNDVIDCAWARQIADKREFLIGLVRCSQTKDPNDVGSVPTWSGCHALISTACVPLMRVGFMPMIPSPVTDYATVRKSLQNFQSVHRQLNPSQSVIPIFCDEGVFHTVADILMAEPDIFGDIQGMMGMFHWVKVLLKCAGRYLLGSGIEDGLIETGVFGKMTLNSVLEGTHYVRSFQGICIVSDVITSLMWEAFWLWISDNERQVIDDVMICTAAVRTSLCEKSRSKCMTMFSDLEQKSDNIQMLFQSFVEECKSKSDMCQYWCVFQQIVLIVKHIISSDREGNFALHIASVQQSLPIFRESDSLNYLRYGSFYLESIKQLQVNYPDIYRRFACGFFVVKENIGSFNAVAPDMKLEQSIQRASKSKGGIVGQTRKTAVVVEWQLIFHEVLLISNNLRYMTNERSMDHSESAQVHHDLVGGKADLLNNNVARLLDFVSNRGNPFIIEAPGIKLHNFITKHIADDAVSLRIRQALVNGENCYKEFHRERFVQRTKKLSGTITKRNLPRMDYKPLIENTAYPTVISPKHLALADRNIDILKQRGMSMESIYSHDILPSSIIFDGDLATKPDKSKLLIEIEKLLVPEELQYPPGGAVVIIDFMSKIRSFPNLTSFGTFGNAINCVLSTGKKLCARTTLHVVFDSYMESSVKSGERTRRAAGVAALDMTHIGPEVPIPKQMDKFWPSPSNKTELQRLTRAVATEQQSLPIILSGCVIDDEVIPATLIKSGTPPDDIPKSWNLDMLTSNIEEADDRLLLHCAWEVSRGCKRILVISNDTDTVVRLLRFINQWLESGLCELWVEFGSGERRRHLPIHTLSKKLGSDLCRVLIKVHVLTGDDALSKIGTKHAGYICEPDRFLYHFAESNELSEESCRMAEEYLVRVWTGVGRKTSCKTFDRARLENYIGSVTPKTLQQLPPTSSVIRNHIHRAFFILRNVLNVLNSDANVLSATDYGWYSDGGTILPAKGMKAIPEQMVVVCKCVGKCNTKRCLCADAQYPCVIYCHTSNTSCSNT